MIMHRLLNSYDRLFFTIVSYHFLIGNNCIIRTMSSKI